MRDAMRDRILDAADLLFARYGYRKTSVEDLAREAGIGKGTIYLYFPSKEEIALSWTDRRIRRLVDVLETIAAGPGRPAERLREMLSARVLVLFDSAQSHAHIFDELYAAIRPAYMPRRQQYFAWEAEVLVRVLEEGRAAGELVFDEALPTARALLLATNGLMPFSLSEQQLRERAQVAAMAERIARLLLEGLCHPVP
ncbi:MAG: TetR/AcrR family transcriptional regulator [Armatimonadota bacterium]